MESRCRAYKNKNSSDQCTANIKSGSFCGKHKNFGEPVYDNKCNLLVKSTINNKSIQNTVELNLGQTIHKTLEKSSLYNDYLSSRKQYIKESNKHIELVEYIENSKLELYPYPRILASLEYYKLIKTSDSGKFMLIINNISLLESFFNLLLKANVHLDKVIKLQRWIKMQLARFCNKLHGAAWHNRALCVNDSDFVSLDDIGEIPHNDFISFKDENGFIYGFSLDSLIELILKTDDNFFENFKKTVATSGMCYRQYIRVLFNHYNKINVNNPYTRDILPSQFKLNVIRLYARKVFQDKNSGNGNNKGLLTVGAQVDMRTQVRNKCLHVFQKIDMLGYMTNTAWLMDENVKNLKIFYKKLAFQWNFEFGLNNTARYNISRTHNLFSNLQDIILSRADRYVLLDKILDTLNILVSNGASDADRNTGSILILYALGSINPRCIEANPWLG
jgi:hypothetical protein